MYIAFKEYSVTPSVTNLLRLSPGNEFRLFDARHFACGVRRNIGLNLRDRRWDRRETEAKARSSCSLAPSPSIYTRRSSMYPRSSMHPAVFASPLLVLFRIPLQMQFLCRWTRSWPKLLRNLRVAPRWVLSSLARTCCPTSPTWSPRWRISGISTNRTGSLSVFLLLPNRVSLESRRTLSNFHSLKSSGLYSCAVLDIGHTQLDVGCVGHRTYTIGHTQLDIGHKLLDKGHAQSFLFDMHIRSSSPTASGPFRCQRLWCPRGLRGIPICSRSTRAC